jgi:hypothetical protein
MATVNPARGGVLLPSGDNVTSYVAGLQTAMNASPRTPDQPLCDCHEVITGFAVIPSEAALPGTQQMLIL